MKREIARGLFLLVALAVTSAALVAWEQPVMQVISGPNSANCPLPRVIKTAQAEQPDHDLLLFMFGMAQGFKGQG